MHNDRIYSKELGYMAQEVDKETDRQIYPEYYYETFLCQRCLRKGHTTRISGLFCEESWVSDGVSCPTCPVCDNEGNE